MRHDDDLTKIDLIFLAIAAIAVIGWVFYNEVMKLP